MNSYEHVRAHTHTYTCMLPRKKNSIREQQHQNVLYVWGTEVIYVPEVGPFKTTKALLQLSSITYFSLRAVQMFLDKVGFSSVTPK